MGLAVVSVRAVCSPRHGGRPRGRPTRGSGQGHAGARDPPVPGVNKSRRVAKVFKRRFRDKIGQGFSGGVILFRDAIDLWYTFPLAH